MGAATNPQDASGSTRPGGAATGGQAAPSPPVAASLSPPMIRMTADAEDITLHWGPPAGPYLVEAWIHDRQEHWTARHQDDPPDAEPITARSAEVLRMRIRRDYQQRTGPVTGEDPA